MLNGIDADDFSGRSVPGAGDVNDDDADNLFRETSSIGGFGDGSFGLSGS